MVNSRRVTAGERLRTAWRRTLFLLLGGLVAIPYALLITWAVSVLVVPRPETATVAVLARGAVLVILALLALPAFLTVTRTLERTAANQLLDLDVPEPGRRTTPADRLRAALFFAGHLVSGAALVFAIGFGIPFTITMAVDAATGSADDPGIESVLPGLATETAASLALVVTALAVALVVASGILLPWFARMLLGPSAEEQLDAANRATAELERRNELARELHDSIGHALTLTTVQAAAARRLIDRDPEAALAAIAEVERAGRTAVADLDYALRVLRTPPQEVSDAATALRRTVDDLVADARAAGLEVRYAVVGDPAALPSSMRSTLYRVVQEALTNALRHASEPRVVVSLTIGASDVVLRVSNPAADARGERPVLHPGIEQRGLRGIRERVAMLGGSSDAELRGGDWVLEVVLPLGGAS